MLSHWDFIVICCYGWTCYISQCWIKIMRYLRYSTYKEKRFVWTHGSRCSNLRPSSCLTLGLWQASTSWQDHEKPKWSLYQPGNKWQRGSSDQDFTTSFMEMNPMASDLRLKSHHLVVLPPPTNIPVQPSLHVGTLGKHLGKLLCLPVLTPASNLWLLVVLRSLFLQQN